MRKLIVSALGAALVLTGCGRAAEDAHADPPVAPQPSAEPSAAERPADPAKTVGTLVNMKSGKRSCTGVVIGRDMVMTAAHCVSAKMTFVPQYSKGERPVGTWKVTGAVADPAWVKSRDDDRDLAFLGVAELNGHHLGDVTGVSTPIFTADPAGKTVRILSYPNDSEVLLTNSSRAVGLHGGQDVRVSGPALSNGSSGSPFYDADGRIVAVLGGFLEGGNTLKVSYATVLDAEAGRLYQRALSTL